jgi:ABC-type Fe3+/spermidine/putrescine transport system ATPase subunit
VVRPEKLVVHPVGAAAPHGPAVRGLVESSIYLGTATQMVVVLAGETRMTALVPNADEAERRRLAGPGDEVRLSWASEHTHLIAGGAAAPSGETHDVPEPATPVAAPA